MPTYEYRCKACRHEFEAVQSFSDDALTECPECQGPLRKVFGNVGITFKGSGFYKTDHGSRAKSSSSNGSNGSDGESSSSSDTKSDTSSSSSSDAKPAPSSTTSSATSAA